MTQRVRKITGISQQKGIKSNTGKRENGEINPCVVLFYSQPKLLISKITEVKCLSILPLNESCLNSYESSQTFLALPKRLCNYRFSFFLLPTVLQAPSYPSFPAEVSDRQCLLNFLRSQPWSSCTIPTICPSTPLMEVESQCSLSLHFICHSSTGTYFSNTIPILNMKDIIQPWVQLSADMGLVSSLLPHTKYTEHPHKWSVEALRKTCLARGSSKQL